ncbi:hypothetical protein TorRG33x02_352380 [Trema orientale]|uniref:Uncharacterized protein n=1 Tax=Trema orientale TaxID=63057 RepID=A0A2P5AEP2_TREOI|nr:hypothetical protein TorRG33x02_352380 [Trema orientale]
MNTWVVVVRSGMWFAFSCLEILFFIATHLLHDLLNNFEFPILIWVIVKCLHLQLEDYVALTKTPLEENRS